MTNTGPPLLVRFFVYKFSTLNDELSIFSNILIPTTVLRTIPQPTYPQPRISIYTSRIFAVIVSLSYGFSFSFFSSFIKT